MKNLLEIVLSGLRRSRAKNGIAARGEAGRAEDDFALISLAGTVLLSAACLAVLWLQWEQAVCIEAGSGGECAVDVDAGQQATNDGDPLKVR